MRIAGHLRARGVRRRRAWVIHRRFLAGASVKEIARHYGLSSVQIEDAIRYLRELEK